MDELLTLSQSEAWKHCACNLPCKSAHLCRSFLPKFALLWFFLRSTYSFFSHSAFVCRMIHPTKHSGGP